jgi:hypothetical protein
MATDISPTTPATVSSTGTPAPIPAGMDDGRKKNNVDHEEFGDTEMEDLRKPADEQRIEVTPEDVRSIH